VLVSLGDGTFDGCTFLASTGLESNTSLASIGAFNFSDCTSLASTGLESNTSLASIGAAAFQGCTSLVHTGLATNSTVASMGMQAFYGCTSLASTGLESNSTVPLLDSNVFNGCTSLASTGLESNSTVTSVGMQAFYGCTSLASTGLATNSTVASVDAYAFMGCAALVDTGLASNSKITSIKDATFAQCTSLTSTGLGQNASVSSVGQMAFGYCTSLKSTGLESNSTLATLDAGVFGACTSLTSTGLATNSTLSSIGAQAFYGCTSLASTGLEANVKVTSIGEGAFQDDSLLGGDLVLGSAIVSVGASAFSGTGFSAAYLATPSPSGFSAGDEAFHFAAGYSNLYVPASWAGTVSLATDSHTYLASDGTLVPMVPKSFSDVSVVRSSSDAATVLFMPSATGAVTVADPKGTVLWSGTAAAGQAVQAPVSDIGPSARGLTVYYVSAMYPDGAKAAAYNTAATAPSTVTVPAFSYSVSFDGNGADGGGMAALQMSWGTPAGLPANAFSRTGFSFMGWNTKADGTGTAYAEGADVSDLTKDASVTLYAQWKGEIGTVFESTIKVSGVDYSCTYMATGDGVVQVGDGKNAAIKTSAAGALEISSSVTYGGFSYMVTSIGNCAFKNCTLLTSTGLELNTSVASVGNEAFSNCASLAATGFGSNSKVASIGDYAFMGCISLASTGLETNSAVTSIGKDLFAYCTALTSTGLGGNLKVASIGADAFAQCTSLSSTGLGSNASVVSVGDSAFQGCTALVDSGLEANSTVKSIGAHSFEWCTSLISTGLGTNVADALAEDCDFASRIKPFASGLESNSKVASIGDYAFHGCTSLAATGLETNSSVTSIGSGVFADCTKLAHAAIDSSAKSISAGCFSGDSVLKDVCFYGNGVPTDGSWLEGAPSPVSVYYLSENSAWSGKSVPDVARASDSLLPLSNLKIVGGSVLTPSSNYWASLPGTAAAGRYARGDKVNVAVSDNDHFMKWAPDDSTGSFDDPLGLATFYVVGSSAGRPSSTVSALNGHKVSYSVSGDAPSGYVPPADGRYAAGDAVAVAPAPATEGFVFSGWSYRGAPAASLGMPDADVVLTGSWSKTPANAGNGGNAPAGTSDLVSDAPSDLSSGDAPGPASDSAADSFAPGTLTSDVPWVVEGIIAALALALNAILVCCIRNKDGENR